ncbi:tRNA threonylcarbamoyladenosine dehydratase [Anaerotalea alkaliphila]|uniref:tRNA threonylcarbamoyladenosine dehydratase n=1 Tax=Anaerotalea alkaliphila TaxID=2662126 RepID=A0A7X5HX09_9FIRM|nr:tRNA threonylcarbamoyladenosine dehydratase [Anaerotalea alkaliphila]
MEVLRNATVAVFGLGGVGSYVVEGLVRSGIGCLHLVDHDKVDVTNINRQLIATQRTLGREKVDVARERVLDINPHARVECHPTFFLPENAESFDFARYDYVVDAIDTVSAKLALVEACGKAGTPIISSMGTGNKLDPTRLEVADIYETSVCPLAKVMRKELRARGVERLKVVYSREEPLSPRAEEMEDAGLSAASGAVGTRKRQTPGSVAFVPPVAGLIIAGEVVKDLLKESSSR